VSAAARRLAILGLAVAALLSLTVLILDLGDIDLPGRAPLAVAFMTLVPGTPIAVALRLADIRITVVLAVSVSIAVALLAGTAMSVVDGWWQPSAYASLIGGLDLAMTPMVLVLLDPGIPTRPTAAGADSAPGRRRASSMTSLLKQPRLLGLASVGMALGLWVLACRQLDASRAGVYGLLPIAPLSYWLALLVLVAVAAWSLLRSRVDQVVLAAAAIALAGCLYLTVSIADGAGGLGAGWVHVGFIDFIDRTGDLATGVDARFSWPGFLAAAAAMVDLGGLHDASPFLIAAPLYYCVVAMPATWLIGRIITGSIRLAWLAVLLQIGFNWYQQDYFSSQGTAFVLYTAVLTILLWAVSTAELPPIRGRRELHWLRAMQRIPGRPGGDHPLGPGQLLVLELLLVAVIGAIVVSHQLTPIALIAGLFWLLLAGALRLRTLPLVTLAVFTGWFSYGAQAFWSGHLAQILGDLGQVGNTVSGGVTGRLVGDPERQRLLLTRIATTGVLLILAGVGWLLARKHRLTWVTAGLAAAPWTILAVQSYGGEVVIRCALYAGPILAPLAAITLGRLGRLVLNLPRLAKGAVPILAGVLAVLFVGLTLTRSLNVAFERVSTDQVSDARWLLDQAPSGATIAEGAAVGPLTMAGLGKVTVSDLVSASCTYTLAQCINLSLTDTSNRPDYIYLTLGQDAYGHLQFGWPKGWTEDVVTQAKTKRYAVVRRSAEAIILKRQPATSTDATTSRSGNGGS